AERGYDQGWGMGRHVLGSNIFHYVRDPWGSHAELTAGLEYIAADADWVAGDHAAHDAFYLWGPPPPPGFIDNPEITQTEQTAAA
ncbi:MAG: metapyrocatechase, partial [Rhizorhabdus sp.]|nr:metapyrocatechase [Rhizorhabdus sp.]